MRCSYDGRRLGRHVRWHQRRLARASQRPGHPEGQLEGALRLRQLCGVRSRLAVHRAGLRGEGAQEGARHRREVRQGPPLHGQDLGRQDGTQHPRGILRRLEGRQGEGARALDHFRAERAADGPRARVRPLPALPRRVRGRQGWRQHAAGGVRTGVDRRRRQKGDRDRLEGRQPQAAGVRLCRQSRRPGRAQGQAGPLRVPHRLPRGEDGEVLDDRVRGRGCVRRFAQEGERQGGARPSEAAGEAGGRRRLVRLPLRERHRAWLDPRFLEHRDA